MNDWMGYSVLCFVCSMHLSWRFGLISLWIMYAFKIHLRSLFGWMSRALHTGVCVCVSANGWDRKRERELLLRYAHTHMQTANQHNGHGSESIEWPNKIECAVYVKSPWNNVVVFHSFTPSSALSLCLPVDRLQGMLALSSTLSHRTTLNFILINKTTCCAYTATCKRPNN